MTLSATKDTAQQGRTRRHEVTTRMPPELAEAAKSRAASLGMSQTDYIMSLVAADVFGSRQGRRASLLRARQALDAALAEIPEEEAIAS